MGMKRSIKEAIALNVRLIAYPNTYSQVQDKGSIYLQHITLPLLHISSYLYQAVLQLRYSSYKHGLLKETRLPLPVISVGNLTWGGTGKTPMTEFITESFISMGIKPLILTRGYGGGDEVRQMESHFSKKLAIIGVGKNRSSVAKVTLNEEGIKRGFCKTNLLQWLESQSSVTEPNFEVSYRTQKSNVKSSQDQCSRYNIFGDDRIGVAILDDGFQHLSLTRDLDILMVNALTFFGNGHLMPRGPMREHFQALHRVDVIVLHHSDLVKGMELSRMKKYILSFCKKDVSFFHSKMVPQHLHFFRKTGEMVNVCLSVLHGSVVLFVSAIAAPSSINILLENIGVFKVVSLEFEDHHKFDSNDYESIKKKYFQIQKEFKQFSIFILFTEKDLNRDKETFAHEFRECDYVCILCSKLQINSEDSEKRKFFEILVDTVCMKLKKANWNLTRKQLI